jgi:arylformamidase
MHLSRSKVQLAGKEFDQMSEADRAYANAAFIPDGAAYPARWAAAAAAYRATARARLDQPFGAGLAFDLFLPEGPARGTVVFIHGGYWMAFGRKDWSHLAAGCTARGWAVAIPSYPLAPAARIAAMAPALAPLIAGLAGPVVLTGHSAGGHLSARLAQTVPGTARVVPISPLADLRPLLETGLNATLALDAGEAHAESPALHPPPACPAHVHVGAQERPAFLWQARSLSEAWACDWTIATGRHHFDVIDDLADPGSALTRRLTAPLSSPNYSRG